MQQTQPLTIFMQFQTSSGMETCKEIPELSRLKFLEKFSANNFALSDPEENTSRPLKRGGIADLPLLRILLAIYQKSQEQIFWEVTDSCFCQHMEVCQLQEPFCNDYFCLCELSFIFRLFYFLVQSKKVISMNYGSSMSS